MAVRMPSASPALTAASPSATSPSIRGDGVGVGRGGARRARRPCRSALGRVSVISIRDLLGDACRFARVPDLPADEDDDDQRRESPAPAPTARRLIHSCAMNVSKLGGGGV